MAIAAVWLGHNAGQLAKSRDTFGVAMTSGGNWFSFSADAGHRLFGGAMLALISCGLLFSKRRRLALLLFPFVLAPVTRGGPPRVYLPLVPIGLLTVALIPLRGLPTSLAWWTPTDWRRVVPALQQQLPQGWTRRQAERHVKPRKRFGVNVVNLPYRRPDG
jgi:hypothetical protein